MKRKWSIFARVTRGGVYELLSSGTSHDTSGVRREHTPKDEVRQGMKERQRGDVSPNKNSIEERKRDVESIEFGVGSLLHDGDSGRCASAIFRQEQT